MPLKVFLHSWIPASNRRPSEPADLPARIRKVSGKNPKAKFDTTKPDGYPRRAADTTLLRKHTGFVPSISLEDGLKEMLEYFLSKTGKDPQAKNSCHS